MNSTASAPATTAQSPNPPGLSPARKRRKGEFEGIGFILSLWVQRLYRKGRLPTARSFLFLVALAELVDVDGRWSFCYLENLPERCNGFLSVSSIKRAIEDLIEAGLIRKLSRSETLDFFAADIARGRSIYRLPCVLEVLVPAEVYPEPVLAEINACRESLGEEPLTPHNRPPLKRIPKAGTRAQNGLGPAQIELQTLLMATVRGMGWVVPSVAAKPQRKKIGKGGKSRKTDRTESSIAFMIGSCPIRKPTDNSSAKRWTTS